MMPNQNLPLNLIFSSSHLCTVFAQHLMLEADRGNIVVHSNVFLIPTCSVDEPFNYISQMYIPPSVNEPVSIERTLLRRCVDKGYSIAHRLLKRLLVSYTLRQKIKEGMKRLLKHKPVLVKGAEYPLFPKVTYEALWERFFADTLASYYRPFLKNCQVKWYRGEPEITHEEGDQGIFIVASDRIKQTSSNSFYFILVSGGVERSDLIEKENTFFIFDLPSDQLKAIQLYPELIARSACLPMMSFVPGKEALSNRNYAESLVDRYKVGYEGIEGVDHFIYLDLDQTHMTPHGLTRLNEMLAAHDQKLKAVCLTSDEKVKTFSHIVFIKDIEEQHLECLIKEASLYGSFSDTRQACRHALYAGYYGIDVVAISGPNFKWYFESSITYINTVDELAHCLQRHLGDHKASLSYYVRERFSMKQVDQALKAVIHQAYQYGGITDKVCCSDTH